jgi:hypothetical protein
MSHAATSACIEGDLGQAWASEKFASQTSQFTVMFDATPTSDNNTGLIGLSNGAQTVDTKFAALLRLSADGVVEALNGTAFSALQRIQYHADASYRFRFDVNPTTRTYSVWMQRQGGKKARPFVRIARDFAFGAQSGATQLDTLGVHLSPGAGVQDFTTGDNVQVCNLAVQTVPVAPPNADCTLIVPDNPLTPAGLATPYQLVATDPAQGACHQANPDQAAFVQAAVIDPHSGKISIYSPLVIDKSTTPAVAPVLPVLPAGAVVAIWFGYNGDHLTLRGGQRGALAAGSCVNGVGSSVFGQFAYCNAPAFFDAARSAIGSGKLVVPPLGTGVDGQACPTSRSYWVIDQDPSDNVPTEYLDINGKFAQATTTNRAQYPSARKFGNPSDERLVAIVLDPVLKCAPYSAPNLADPGQNVTALALNELQATQYQQRPVALIPPQDPMALIDGVRSLEKLNAYRIGVGQPLANDTSDTGAANACRNLREIAPARFMHDKPWFINAASPVPADANSLYTFLSNRYVTSYELLDCKNLLRQRVNVKLTKDANGVVIDATPTR